MNTEFVTNRPDAALPGTQAATDNAACARSHLQFVSGPTIEWVWNDRTPVLPN